MKKALNIYFLVKCITCPPPGASLMVMVLDLLTILVSFTNELGLLSVSGASGTLSDSLLHDHIHQSDMVHNTMVPNEELKERIVSKF